MGQHTARSPAVTLLLLRGVNVGGHGKLPMKALVELLQDMGYDGVQSYIQSGNVVMGSPRALTDTDAMNIATRIEQSHGFRPYVLALDAADWQRVIDDNPFPQAEGAALHAFLLGEPARYADVNRMERLKAHNEAFAVRDRVVYLHAPDGTGRSKLAPVMEKCLGVPCTARNWNTVLKLAAMARQFDETLILRARSATDSL